MKICDKISANRVSEKGAVSEQACACRETAPFAGGGICGLHRSPPYFYCVRPRSKAGFAAYTFFWFMRSVAMVKCRCGHESSGVPRSETSLADAFGKGRRVSRVRAPIDFQAPPCYDKYIERVNANEATRSDQAAGGGRVSLDTR